LIDAALTSYVKRHVPDALLNYRQQVQQEAARLYEGNGRAARLPSAKRSQK
jgi:hypothetical protein